MMKTLLFAAALAAGTLYGAPAIVAQNCPSWSPQDANGNCTIPRPTKADDKPKDNRPDCTAHSWNDCKPCPPDQGGYTFNPPPCDHSDLPKGFFGEPPH